MDVRQSQRGKIDVCHAQSYEAYSTPWQRIHDPSEFDAKAVWNLKLKSVLMVSGTLKSMPPKKTPKPKQVNRFVIRHVKSGELTVPLVGDTSLSVAYTDDVLTLDHRFPIHRKHCPALVLPPAEVDALYPRVVPDNLTKKTDKEQTFTTIITNLATYYMRDEDPVDIGKQSFPVLVLNEDDERKLEDYVYSKAIPVEPEEELPPEKKEEPIKEDVVPEPEKSGDAGEE
jgi:hypothetical protein